MTEKKIPGLEAGVREIKRNTRKKFNSELPGKADASDISTMHCNLKYLIQSEDLTKKRLAIQIYNQYAVPLKPYYLKDSDL